MSEYTTKDGAILRIRAVPSLVVQAIQKSIGEPKVPIYRNEEKQRDEENPIDPNYLAAVKDYNDQVGERTIQAYLANGVEVISLPDGMYPIDDEQWCDGLKFAGLDVPDSGMGRKVAYLRWYLIGDTDVSDVIAQIAVAGGVVSEEQVKQAAESFRDNQNGTANTEVPVSTPG